MRFPVHLRQYGFTIIEVIMILVIIGILSGLTYSFAVPKYRQRTYITRAASELSTMANALKLYLAKYNDYPPDVVRDVPSGIKEFVQGQYLDSWPDAPFPGSVYDYDNWPPDGNGPEHTYQISIRMCQAGENAICNSNANKYLKGTVSDSVLANWDSYSAMYYCIKGSCRSHQSKPMDHPGYCVNCNTKNVFF